MNSLLLLITLLSLIITLSRSDLVFEGEEGVDFEIYSPFWSKFIPPNPVNRLENAKIVSLLDEDYLNLCTPVLHNEYTGKVVAVKGILTTAVGGYCKYETPYKTLIDAGAIGIILIIPQFDLTRAGTHFNVHSGNFGKELVEYSAPMYSIGGEDLDEVLEKLNIGVDQPYNLQTKYMNASVNEWDAVYRSTGWELYRKMGGVVWFMITFAGIQNQYEFEKIRRSKKSKDFTVQVVLVITWSTSLILGLITILGFGYSTDVVPGQIHGALISMMSGPMVFSLMLTAFYFQDQKYAIKKLRVAENTLVSRKYTILGLFVVVVGIDLARSVGALLFFSDPIFQTLGGGIYTIFQLLCVIVFSYQGYSFLRLIHSNSKSIQENKTTTTTTVGTNLKAASSSPSLFGTSSPNISQKRSDLSKSFRGQSFRVSTQLSSLKNMVTGQKSPTLESEEQRRKKSRQAREVIEFLRHMSVWLLMCAAFQVVWIASLPMVLTGYIFNPVGNYQFLVMVSIGRIGTNVALTVAFTPASLKVRRNTFLRQVFLCNKSPVIPKEDDSEKLRDTSFLTSGTTKETTN